MSDANYDKRLSTAADHLGENTLWLIQQVLRKHDKAVIEASIEAVRAAVLAEREARALVAETYLDDPVLSGHGYATGCARAIRERDEE